MKKDFIHLHLHTDYSMMDGCQKPEQLFKRATELGFKKLAITNHGNMINMPKLIDYGKKNGIQVIPGCELYVCWDHPAAIKDDEHKKIYHMIALAMNDVGYKNLIKLTTKGFLEGKYYKPRVDRAMLEEHAEGIIILTACVNGTLANFIGKQGKCPADLKQDVLWLKETFGDRVYLEIQRHPDFPEQDLANAGITELSKEFNVPMVATCDAHYAVKQHFDAWQSMMLIQTNGKFGHDAANDYYLKSADEMNELYADMPQVIEETVKIGERCLPIKFDKSIKYPPFDTGGDTPDAFLLKKCATGLDWRISKGHIPMHKKKLYKERYEYECKVLAEKNFSTYILIVADYTTWAKDQGILMAPARGSGAGSLALYLTRTTEVDPMNSEYDLIFERFINPERNSFPDIDQDFQDDRREEVVQYMYDKYGTDKVARIMTIGTLAAKGAIREVCRRFEIPFQETNELAKLIPGPVRGRNTNLETALTMEPRFAKAIADNPLYRKVYDIASVMEGMAKSTGIHAAGIILSDHQPLINHIALMLAKGDVICTSDDMKVLEDLGFIKFDFLGLRTLTIVQVCREWIKAIHGIDIDPYEIPLDDPLVYEMIRCGKIFGVFQIGGSSGFRDVAMKMAPRSIANLSDINAVYRPGPLDNGFDEQYAENVKRIERGEPIEYMMKVDHPGMQKEIEAILKRTFGVCLYQEQIQFIAQKVAGYTLGGADNLRRAIGKKLPAEMEVQRKIFTDGCVKNGISQESAEELFNQIFKFGDYCFNKSHSVSYSIVSYWTAWLKYYYPNEFMAANLTLVQGDQDKTIEFINACREEGIKILPPDINVSDLGYTPSQEGIRFGLGAVKGLGESAINPILEERKTNGKFSSFFNFMNRFKDQFSKVKKSDITTLIKSGSFDSLEKAA